MRVFQILLNSAIVFVFTSSCSFGQEPQPLSEEGRLLMNEIVAWKEALAIYENDQDYYKLACLYSKIGEPDSAFRYLKRSMESGYLDLRILVDPELANMAKYEEEIGEGWSNLYPEGDFNYALNLLKIEYSDQRSRSVLYECLIDHGRDSDEFQEQLDFMRISDSLNVLKLQHLIDAHGWPNVSRVGESAISSAYTVLLHSNSDIKKTYLPFIKKSVQEGELQKSALAYFIDKMKMAEGEKQIYGTQFSYNDSTGKYELYPVLNEDELNKRRFEMGLDSIESYLRHMFKEYNR